MDPALLGRLLDEHAAALELFAAQWTRSPDDAVQEAFLELVRQATPPDRIVPWLYRVVRNRAVSLARAAGRRARREAAAAATEPWFVPDPAAAHDADVATQALAALPIEQREVIVARLWGRLNFDQIAEIADVSISTAQRRYEAGLAELRRRLDAPCPHAKPQPTT